MPACAARAGIVVVRWGVAARPRNRPVPPLAINWLDERGGGLPTKLRPAIRQVSGAPPTGAGGAASSGLRRRLAGMGLGERRADLLGRDAVRLHQALELGAGDAQLLRPVAHLVILVEIDPRAVLRAAVVQVISHLVLLSLPIRKAERRGSRRLGRRAFPRSATPAFVGAARSAD